jgi:hypothetical protein
MTRKSSSLLVGFLMCWGNSEHGILHALLDLAVHILRTCGSSTTSRTGFTVAQYISVAQIRALVGILL